jgi:predicted peptidase
LNCRVDSDRCYLSGYIYGGMCTWAIEMAVPERYAAIVSPSCRLHSAPETAAENLINVGVW